ncbi:MAG: radical SAM family heme chaperone HemW [Candidatus Eremiobacteraeota bacterium]|nr:radical SAM family heme chaperone HemW [Candidatus Eremiobacteraeota bacterium]
MTGVYVHLPFCPYICPYCDFAKWPHRRSMAERYLSALAREIAAHPPAQASSIFLGGGTPNAYPASDIALLAAQLRTHFTFSSNPEFTIELNPELVLPDDFERYAAAGINRVSIGVQSFISTEIATLGRRHTRADVEAAVQGARAAGIRSISLDLMFAVPGQTAESWRTSLQAAIDLGLDHISTYGLTIEDGTPYAIWQQREPAAFFDDGREADLYEITIKSLETAGFEQYEISNFSTPGHRCAHNANYWENGEYIGLGVGAASYRDGVRSVHTRELSVYLEAIESGCAIPAEAERLEGARAAGEAVMLALRTSQGVSFAPFKERYGLEFLEFYAPVVERFVDDGLLAIDSTRARLTRRGRFLANDVCGAFVTFA